jgi:nucleoid-associated protein YgaU
MTRENKLALVLGFGLLLLAGILVSDYLSAGNRVHEDPLIAASSSQIPNSEILKPAVPLQLERTQRPVQTAQERTPAPLRQITLGTPNARTQNSSSAVSGRKTAANVDTYYVKSGESLSIISIRYYGSAEYVDQIARVNNLGNPNQVKVGTRLILPKSFNQTTIATSGDRSTPSPANVQKKRQTVKVREGETLSDIAKRELGDGTKWRTLWKANMKVVPNPDRLRPGTILQLPTN